MSGGMNEWRNEWMNALWSESMPIERTETCCVWLGPPPGTEVIAAFTECWILQDISETSLNWPMFSSLILKSSWLTKSLNPCSFLCRICKMSWTLIEMKLLIWLMNDMWSLTCVSFRCNSLKLETEWLARNCDECWRLKILKRFEWYPWQFDQNVTWLQLLNRQFQGNNPLMVLPNR